MGQDCVRIEDDAFAKLMEYSWPGQYPAASQRAAHRIGAVPRRHHPLLESAAGDSRYRSAVGAGRIRQAGRCRTDRGHGGALPRRPPHRPKGAPSAALREAECAALLRELERMRWNISRTAQTLGISRNTLYRKIHKHRILLEH